MEKYNPKEIEPKWQQFWEKNNIFSAQGGSASGREEAKKKFYSLIEFPYPSGAGLHVGHARPFTAMDIVSRYKRMQGYNVLYPIGFDAFGLPTENYAIKTGRPPADVTAENIANFTRQLKALGYSFDWSRQVDTTDPKYYKWTQWLFLQFYKHGLAYKKNQPINWCPKDKIGLANEEVVNGCCERCGTPVEKRNKEQWMLAITKYADKLLEGLKEVDYIPQARVQQENWIGRSEGAEVNFVISNPSVASGEKSSSLKGQLDSLPTGQASSSASGLARNDKWTVTVFTTRPDTIFGVTFIAVSAELAKERKWDTSPALTKYIEATIAEQKTTDREEKEKTGVDSGMKAINPVNGEEIPVWITNYVMGGVGTGAVMGVPAHDERDFEFAKKYNLLIKPVVAAHFIEPENPPQVDKKTVRRKTVHVILTKADGSVLMLNWKANPRKDGLYPHTFLIGGVEGDEDVVEAARREVLEETGYTSVRYVRTVNTTLHTEYYAGHKNENRYAEISILHFELENEDHEAVDASENAKHEMVWVEAAKVPHYVNVVDGNFVWNAFVKETAYTDVGLAVNSDFLNGLTTVEAKEKMITWLEEKGVGKRKVNYKLRDWVFSRQRYWGEPIPLVHCENCAKHKGQVVIVHGFGGTGDENWFSWLRKELEAQGYEVFAPNLPNTTEPDITEWVEALKKLALDPRQELTIVAHSLGGPTAIQFIREAHLTVAKLVLVAPVFKTGPFDHLKEEDFSDQEIARLRFFADTSLTDLSTIKKQIGETVLILSKDDPYIPLRTEKDYVDLQPRTIIFEDKEHFSKNHGQLTEFPEILSEFANENSGWVPLPESELPLTLPKVEKYEPTDNGESPLAPMTDWVNTTCPRCGGPAKRETDTMPNWAGSSWYFLRYCDPHNDTEFASMEKLQYWMAIDWYNGGMEHTVLHLLYSRFWNQFLFDIGLVPTFEPYKKRTSHGLILGPDGEKMSKSRGNVVNPDEMIEKFGTDAFRTYIAFMGPFDQPVKWDTNGLVGVQRFLEKVWALKDKVIEAPAENNGLTTLVHQTIKKVSDDIEKMSFNTAVAALMEFTNALTKEEKISKAGYSVLVKLVSPFAPHMCEELWSLLGNAQSIAMSEWPKFDAELAKESTLTIVFQVNGKVRDEIIIDAHATEDDVKKLALASEKVQKWLEGKEPKKVIYVKGKLVSIVV